MKEHKQNRFAALCIHAVCLLLVMALAIPVCATNPQGSLRLNCVLERDGETVCLSGDEYAIVQILRAAVIAEDGRTALSYEIRPEYAQFDCDWESLTVSQMTRKAREMAQAISAQAYQAAGVSDADGVVMFEGLEPGMYLVIRSRVAAGNEEYFCDPWLVSIPLIVEDTVTWDVVSDPKFAWDSPDEPTEPEKPTDPSIPQTGQANWPIPVLAISGGIFLAVGTWLWDEEKKKEMTR